MESRPAKKNQGCCWRMAALDVQGIQKPQRNGTIQTWWEMCHTNIWGWHRCILYKHMFYLIYFGDITKYRFYRCIWNKYSTWFDDFKYIPVIDVPIPAHDQRDLAGQLQTYCKKKKNILSTCDSAACQGVTRPSWSSQKSGWNTVLQQHQWL